MVVFSFPQCHSHGWSWCPQSPLRHVRARMVCLHHNFIGLKLLHKMYSRRSTQRHLCFFFFFFFQMEIRQYALMFLYRIGHELTHVSPSLISGVLVWSF
jgi:hypothetical protein